MAEHCEIVEDQAQASDAIQLGLIAAVSDAARAGDGLAITLTVSLSDAAAAGDAVSWSAGVALSDAATANDSVAIGGAYTLAISDVATASDQHRAGHERSVSDTATAGDGVSLALSMSVSDPAAAADSLVLGLALGVSDTATAADGVRGGAAIATSDVAQASDAVSWSMRLVAAVSDAAQASDAHTIGLAMQFSLSDAALASDAHEVGGSYSLLISDTAYANDSVPTAPRAYSASTDLLAITEWTGVGANSAASAYGSIMLGADDGLIALRGDADRGAPITTARVVTGLLDSASSTETGHPGNTRQQRIDKMYFSRRGVNPLLVTVANTQIGDELVDLEYPVPDRVADVLITERVSIGRGARARYFRFGIANPGGGAFELRDWYVLTTDTQRRV